MIPNLPITDILPTLAATLAAHGRAVLTAPPGAGKTTLVPIALFDEEWMAGKRIVMLEPRRIAARAAAMRIADLLGEPLGRRVGYAMRGERKGGRDVRILVVTEGVLTRMLRSDPSLADVGLVIFDEFHERSLNADLGLALTLQSRELFRPDLRLLVMSATLDADAVARLLDDAPIVRSEGRAYPVETRYVGRAEPHRIHEAAASAVARALREEPEGDLLAFLPGMGEIARTLARLDEHRHQLPNADRLRILPLYGHLSKEEQDRAIRPSIAGERKVVLATSIAETSLTIDGVRIVVDAGLSRVSRFNPAAGLSRLVTVRVARASAEQRRGRAGRLAPGVCYRLWDQREEVEMLPAAVPEIMETDLVPLALDLHAWGATPDDLRWIDPPPRGAYAAAVALLADLGAIDRGGSITPVGERMASLPIHPRLARMVIRAERGERLPLALLIAALLEEGDIVKGEARFRDPDLRTRLDALADAFDRRASLPHHVDRNAVRRVLKEAERLARIVGATVDEKDFETAAARSDAIGPLLAHAYPDRIARRRDGSDASYLLSNGGSARLQEAGHLGRDPFLVVAALGGSGREGRIEMAAPIDLEEIRSEMNEAIERVEEVEWVGGDEEIAARRREALGALTLTERALHDPPEERIVAAILEAVRRDGLALLPWTRESTALRNRIAFLHRRHDAAWPAMTDAALIETLDVWLAPLVAAGRWRRRVKVLDMR